MSMKEVFQKIIGSKVLVKHIMREEFVQVNEDMPLHTVAKKLIQLHLSHVVVVNDGAKVVGIMSVKHLYKAQSPRRIIDNQLHIDSKMIIDGDSYFEPDTVDSYQLKKLMRTNPPLLRPGQGLEDAIKLMASKNVDFVPVVNNKREAVGVIYQLDVIRYISSLLENES